MSFCHNMHIRTSSPFFFFSFCFLISGSHTLHYYELRGRIVIRDNLASAFVCLPALHIICGVWLPYKYIVCTCTPPEVSVRVRVLGRHDGFRYPVGSPTARMKLRSHLIISGGPLHTLCLRVSHHSTSTIEMK